MSGLFDVISPGAVYQILRIYVSVDEKYYLKCLCFSGDEGTGFKGVSEGAAERTVRVRLPCQSTEGKAFARRSGWEQAGKLSLG